MTHPAWRRPSVTFFLVVAVIALIAVAGIRSTRGQAATAGPGLVVRTADGLEAGQAMTCPSWCGCTAEERAGTIPAAGRVPTAGGIAGFAAGRLWGPGVAGVPVDWAVISPAPWLSPVTAAVIEAAAAFVARHAFGRR